MTNLTDTNGKALGNNAGALSANGTTVPADGTAGYNTGCIFQETDGTAPAVLFQNLGTTASALFRPVGVGASTNDGPNAPAQVRFTYNPSANTSTRAAATYSLAATVPTGALVTSGFVYVNTAFSSSGSTASVALFLQGANDVIAAATVGGAPWATVGTKATLVNGSTAGGGIATTAAQAVKVIVANEAVTGGKFTGVLNYIPNGVA